MKNHIDTRLAGLTTEARNPRSLELDRLDTLVQDGATSSPYYSAAVRAGDFMFVSGQGPWDRKSGTFVDGPIEIQTEVTLENVKAVLKAAEAGMDDVLQVHVHLR